MLNKLVKITHTQNKIKIW